GWGLTRWRRAQRTPRNRAADRLRRHRREDRRARAIPSRSSRLAHPWHGRRPVARREGSADRGPGAGRGDGEEAPRGHLHPRGLPRSAQAGAGARPARSGAGHAAVRKDAQGGAEGARRRAGGPGSLRCDHQLDDARGATQSGGHQWLAPPAHRARQRLDRAGRQPAAQAVRAAQEDDEAVQDDGRPPGEAERPRWLSDAEGVTTWQWPSDSDAKARASDHAIAWWWRTRERRATGASSR